MVQIWLGRLARPVYDLGKPAALGTVIVEVGVIVHDASLQLGARELPERLIHDGIRIVGDDVESLGAEATNVLDAKVQLAQGLDLVVAVIPIATITADGS